ncbi:ATP-binding cassette domain-containing protein [Humidisolicoccus flavus]|uniref:ATP-binding cassette domain-containing protein n=1 Tax=Humidisolicoccus flavus TaxID=3111414 RepID=UPI00325099F1
MHRSIAAMTISHAYGRDEVLRNVSIEFPAGAVTALVGANGSGKSTLLSVLAGVLQPDSGVVERRGFDAARGRAAGPLVAFVPQRSRVTDALPITVAEAIALGRWGSLPWYRKLGPRDHEIVEEEILRFDLSSLRKRRLTELSGGQRQRALVAQGFAQRAPILLLDEPGASVDGASRDIIDEALAGSASEGAVVVHATHDPESARRSSTVVTLDHGAVVSADLASKSQ